MQSIPKEFLDLLDDKTKSFVFLATSMPDGSPQVTPVWFNTMGEHILINSAKGRIKDRNMRAQPWVALAVADPNNPYRYIQIRGRVVEITEEGAREHINALSNKYTGNPVYPRSPDEVRVKYKIKIENVHAMG